VAIGILRYTQERKAVLLGKVGAPLLDNALAYRNGHDFP
jgi:hypothetical protein